MNKEPFYYTWSHQSTSAPFPVESAEHDEFVLADGRRIYDFISTSFQTSFGHSNSIIRRRICSQLDHMPIASPKATFALKSNVSEQLIDRLGLPGGKIFYTVSGSESVENALKMARQSSGRTMILARKKVITGPLWAPCRLPVIGATRPTSRSITTPCGSRNRPTIPI